MPKGILGLIERPLGITPLKMMKSQVSVTCECVDCGYTTEPSAGQHCYEMTCPECGGEMRREERPGPGTIR